VDLVSADGTTTIDGLELSTAVGLRDYHDEIMIREVILSIWIARLQLPKRKVTKARLAGVALPR
jgi:hypothetical protein